MSLQNDIQNSVLCVGGIGDGRLVSKDFVDNRGYFCLACPVSHRSEMRIAYTQDIRDINREWYTVERFVAGDLILQIAHPVNQTIEQTLILLFAKYVKPDKE